MNCSISSQSHQLLALYTKKIVSHDVNVDPLYLLEEACMYIFND
ncbi:unnamed protein product [Musa acuminata subsp. malaccensis]|uniref:(wild Malaysian banana) hypothetical protein n=1 Tax=Musa acuminata subsp. malaccensis TaxID=214687 RepID=A0A804JMM4_MUSAM|nr:unnamed protein product [Musa acuminata subsp. malaccensis]